MSARPRVLILSPIHPARSGNGLAMRVSLFVEAAETFAEVDVVVVPVAGQSPAPTSPLRRSTRLHCVPARLCRPLMLIDRIPGSERVAAFRSYGQPSLSGYLTDEAHALVEQLASARVFDLVVVMRSYMLPLAQRVADGPVLALDLDEDEVASAASQARIAITQNEAVRAAWLMAEADAIDRQIALYRPRLQRSFVSCDADARTLRDRQPGLNPKVVHNAITIPATPRRRHDGRTLLFVGAFGHLANVDGIGWFAERVMPRIQKLDQRGADLVVAGTGPPPCVLRMGRHPRIKIRGAFADAGSVYARATVAVAPMRFGGGARTKIIEAAAHGVACVAHRASVNPTLETAGWSAGDALGFATACAEALNDLNARRSRETLGRRIASALYDRTVVIAALSRQLALLAAI